MGDGLEDRYAKTQRPYSDAVVDLAKMEVLNHNKRDLERMLENESHQRTRSITRKFEPTLYEGGLKWRVKEILYRSRDRHFHKN